MASIGFGPSNAIPAASIDLDKLTVAGIMATRRTLLGYLSPDTLASVTASATEMRIQAKSASCIYVFRIPLGGTEEEAEVIVNDQLACFKRIEANQLASFKRIEANQ